jgi:hypothetical protein
MNLHKTYSISFGIFVEHNRALSSDADTRADSVHQQRPHRDVQQHSRVYRWRRDELEIRDAHFPSEYART